MSIFIDKLKNFTDLIPLPGFKGISIFDLLKFLKEVFSKGNFAIRSAAVSFHFFVGIFPALIFLVSLIPYLPIENLQENIFLQMKMILPKDIFHHFENTFKELFIRRHSVVLSIGFFLSIYYASKGINTLLIAFNQSYQVELKRNPIKQRLVSLGLFLVIITLFLAAVCLSIFSEKIFNFLNIEALIHMSITLFYILDLILVLALVSLSISILYYAGNPNIKKFKFINAGSSFATIIILLASWVLSFYFSHFNSYNKIYGSIGSLLIGLLWINTVSYVLIIGFELYTKEGEIKQRKSN
ncbi:MAG: hypothetical protein CL846_05000 [Crocinitomicaceae bacterium]|nr:hypothetical protein [Crocinitomicaceae bacterium]|tara:strand:+ start:6181 stop:7074 length:894 start_codon:yes stop_codon:yes gene_type:complete